LVRKRSSLKHRVRAQLLAFGHRCAVSDLFGRRGRELLGRLDFPEPWRSGVLAAVAMIDDLDREIAAIDRELRRLGADHRYIPLLLTVPGVALVLGYTIASEIGDIHRFASPKKLCGYTGLCPSVYQSGAKDRRGHLTHAGPRSLRWALMEAAQHACRHPLHHDRYQRNKTGLCTQRGAKVARVDIARRLPGAPGSGCPQLQPNRCDGQAMMDLHLHSIPQRLVAHEHLHPELDALGLLEPHAEHVAVAIDAAPQRAGARAIRRPGHEHADRARPPAAAQFRHSIFAVVANAGHTPDLHRCGVAMALDFIRHLKTNPNHCRQAGRPPRVVGRPALRAAQLPLPRVRAAARVRRAVAVALATLADERALVAY
jgi:transposase IS116/IS110/IS902 family protein